METVQRPRQASIGVVVILVAALVGVAATSARANPSERSGRGLPSCTELTEARGLAGHGVKPRLTTAVLHEATADVPEYCRVEGEITTGSKREGFNTVRFAVNLPTDWNGRYAQLGDGGHDGAVSTSTRYIADGYATANSDMGHEGDSAIDATWAFDNRPAEIDYGWRAVHVTAVAAKRIVKEFYGQKPEFSYHVGLSTGGRQGAVSAQRFPRDFDGIAAGDLFNNAIEVAMEQVWSSAVFFRDVDGDGQGFDNNITQADIDALTQAVLDECDVLGNDKIRDRVVDNPIACAQEFNEADIEALGDERGLTSGQVEAIKSVYAGPSSSTGTQWYKGKALGTEYAWGDFVVPTPDNGNFPGQMGFSKDFVNFLWFEHDPGVPTAAPNDPSLLPSEGEYRWLDFDFDQNTPAGATTNPGTGPWHPSDGGGFMRELLNGSETDLTPFLIRNEAKYLLFHGWGDPLIPPEPTVDYWRGIVEDTFAGDRSSAADSVRLFMVPGKGHGGGGVPGAAVDFDPLAPLAEWVENGVAPEQIEVTQDAVTRTPEGNERIICPWPEQPTYDGPTAGDAQNDPDNWVAANFTCQPRVNGATGP